MRRTVLYNVQRDRGASFTDAGEWELAVEYEDCLVEHKAVREDVGLVDRCARARLAVTGKDRFKWLQGMISNDVTRLESGAPSVCACVLNSTGHVLADVTVVNRPDSLLLDMAWENGRKVYEILQQFIITEDVEIVDQSDGLACISLQGPTATEAWVRQRVAESATVSPADYTGEGGFDLYVKADQAADLWTRLVDSGIQPVGESAVDALRIEAGIPVYGKDMDETTIPLECNLGETHVSENKGCYVGQEIIARISSRGHTNRALTGFFVEHAELPERGDKIYPVDGDATREVGWITSATHSPSLKRSIALGYLRHEYREPGTVLRTGTPETLTVAALPFVPRHA